MSNDIPPPPRQRPALLTITAVLVAFLATVCGQFDLIDLSDAALFLGLSVVLAISGLRE